jgi:hypothetical protein
VKKPPSAAVISKHGYRTNEEHETARAALTNRHGPAAPIALHWITRRYGPL